LLNTYGVRPDRSALINIDKEKQDMDGVKIYGLCLERLKHQIAIAKKRLEGSAYGSRYFLLESYNTGDLEDIVDILELYDLQDKTPELLREKLNDLAYTVSTLMRHTLIFDYTEEGHLGLYLSLQAVSVEVPDDAVGAKSPALSFA
jgi:hypothetical protein